MLSAQSIKLAIPPEIESQGVTLISANSPAAAQYLTHINAATMARMKPLIPYSVVLVNRSSHQALLVTVRRRGSISASRVNASCCSFA